MARKRRTNKAVKRSTRKKSDSDHTSNSVSDENDVETKADSSSMDQQNTIQSPSEKNHKHVGKFRYLERRHSSSQDEDNEFNPTYDNLMPQEINDIVLGNLKQFFITTSDGRDICRDRVVNDSVESDAFIGASVGVTSSYFNNNERTEDIVKSSHGSPNSENIDLIKSFEKTVNINESIKDSNKKSDESKPSDNDLCFKDVNVTDDKIATSEKPVVLDNENSSSTSSSALTFKDGFLETKKCEEDNEKNQSDEPRRRSNRIRVNRWGDEEVKPVLQEEVVLDHPKKISIPTESSENVECTQNNQNKLDVKENKKEFEVQPPPPPPPPNSLFDSDKPVKVKSRWRRTSELEMGGSTGSAAIESDMSVASSLLSESPEASVVDLAVEQGLKSFEIISHNVFIAPRVKSKEKEIKKMICDCSLTKEEIARGDMGCGEDCLNRLLMIECGPRCPLGNYCSNRRFQNCQYTPCQVIKTKKKGLGLIANANVGSGVFLMEYVGEVLDSKEFRKRAKEYSKGKISHFYFMYLKGHTIIDATVKGNISRFINHSCDPNAETQKWTVNGELRIGFFSKRPIAAGEEITFDYKLDRYGKEAQRCFCESSNCRGWIGENPENDKEKDKKESSSKKERKEKRKKEERKRDFMSDRELEEEIEKLASSGVKNQKHTLTLSRLMVRAEEDCQRIQLLEIAQGADIRCLRLFLDYHGLSLLWSWMVDSRCSPELKKEILKTLAVLPVSNRTALQDSKVLTIIEKWANKNKITVDSKQRSNDNDSNESPTDSNEKTDLSGKNEELKKNIASKAAELLEIWSNLKQEFRIPKKERIEQMKEHEREANRGNYSDPRDHLSYDRHWNYDKESRGYEKENRYGNNHRERKRGRESPSETGYGEWRKSRIQQDERHNGGMNRLSKTERRQLFAMKVEEEERQRKMEEEWAKQQNQICVPPGPAPPPMDPNQGYYQPTPFQPPSDGGDMVFGGCPPAFPPPFMRPPHPPPPYMEGPPPSFPPGPPSGPPPSGFHPPPFGHPPIAPPYQPSLPPYPPFPYNAPAQVFPPNPSIPAPSTQNPPLPSSVPLTTPPPGVPITNVPPSVVPLPSAPPPVLNNPPIMSAPLPAVSLSTTPNSGISISTVPPPPPATIARVFPIKLPSKWRSAKDKEGRIYYYHTKTRKSQWQIPTEETAAQASESESDSEESSEDDDSSTEEEEEEEKEEEEEIFEEEENIKKEEDEEYTPEDLKLEDFVIPGLVLPSPPVLKKKREGLVQVNIISPRDGEDDYRCGIKKKQIRQTKERLAREKRRLRSGGAAKCEADTSGGPRRRIKETFRVEMANVIVALLNPYRKQDCKTARITNTGDFKHLARKLTHFVMVKEMKHCASLDELVCNDNVKHKAKDFIRKYMSKFGPVYKRSPDE